MKKILIVGHGYCNAQAMTRAIDSLFEKERGIIIVKKQNPFEPEPIIINNYAGTSPYIHDLRDKKGKILPLPKSKYHK
jgi:NADH dehydrogenase FAD-containing subunit